MFIAYISF